MTPEKRWRAKAERHTAGFTLIELMIVVVIIGVLSAVAIPAFSRAVRRTKTSEAVLNLRRIYDGAVTSFQELDVERNGLAMNSQFPNSVGATPGLNSCCLANDAGRCPANAGSFRGKTWNELGFAIGDPHYYWYEFASNGEGVSASFTARASGNLDCDEIYSTFERPGYVDMLSGRIRGGAGVFKSQPLE